jgi:hypothetical protein
MAAAYAANNQNNWIALNLQGYIASSIC